MIGVCLMWLGIVVAVLQLFSRRALTARVLCWLVIACIVYAFANLAIDWSAWWNDHVLYAMGYIWNKGMDTWRDPVFAFYTMTLRKYTYWMAGYFGLTAFIYLYCYYRASLNFTDKRGTAIMFLAIVCGPFFVAYGVNTIRAGFAMALAILAMSCWYRNKWWAILFGALAVGSHLSVALTVTAFVAAVWIKRPRLCFFVWLVCIGLSLAAGSFFESTLGDLVEDERMQDYTQVAAAQTHYRVGFRWDFVVFSLLPMIVGWYYIYRKHFKDIVYKTLYCTYILSNCVWVLLIRANFSDRFAYLSWALMPILLIYPLVKDPELYGQNTRYLISLTLLALVGMAQMI